ncbi:MAG: hypothetical protein PUB88_11845 [Clostridium sp.]|nr:hypothetical protein [Clostridium sp.]
MRAIAGSGRQGQIAICCAMRQWILFRWAPDLWCLSRRVESVGYRLVEDRGDAEQSF